MLYTSGDNMGYWGITNAVYSFFISKYHPLIDYDVEIYHTDLSADNVKGWQEQNGDEFLIHIDTHLDVIEYIKTLFHELVHCEQDIKGIKDTQTREDEAYHLEEQYSKELMLVTSKVD